MTGTEQVAAASPEACPECEGDITTDDREAICSECGLIIETHSVDHGPDWRDFPEDAGPNQRHAEPLQPLRHDMGLGTNQTDNVTTTDVVRKIASEGTIDSRHLYIRREIYRIGAYLGWDYSHKERGGDLAGKLYDETDILGRDADTVAAAICWLVGRVFGLGLSPADVAEPAREVDPDKMMRTGQWIKRQLDLPIPTANYATRVRRVGATLDLSQPTIEAAVTLVNDLDGTEKCRGSPSALAAAAIYIRSDRTQADVADAAGVTPPTIRNQFDLFEYGGAYDD